ncbi:MAG: hypothetical protein IJT95_05245 [Abditibacteriota bacterium]|nr:hypothetical protein [Abditibacteriota bacterium]
MKNSIYLYIFLIVLLSAPALSEEYPSVFRLPQGDPFVEADEVQGTQTSVTAEGNVEAGYDFYRLMADRLYYKKEEKFRAEGLRLFTCEDRERPHLSVKADSVEAVNDGAAYRISLSGISFNYRDRKILSLPRFNYRYDPDARQGFISLPVPGYSKGKGFTLKYSPVLADSYHAYSSASLEYGTKSKLSFDAGYTYGFDGYLDLTCYKTLRPEDTIKYVTDYSLSFGEPRKPGRRAARLVGEARAIYKHRMSTLNKETINVSRMPQASLTYYFDPIGNAKGIDRRAVLNPSVLVSWCRERDESPAGSIWFDDKYRSKFTTEVELPFAAGSVSGVSIQPAVKGIYNRYEDKSTYKALACGLDLAKFYPDNSFWNLRYMWAKEDGFTPFEFDSVAYEQGLIAAAQKNLGKYIIGGWYAYNFNLHKTYRCGVILGYKTDCFWTGASYDFHDRKLKLGVNILGF